MSKEYCRLGLWFLRGDGRDGPRSLAGLQSPFLCLIVSFNGWLTYDEMGGKKDDAVVRSGEGFLT